MLISLVIFLFFPLFLFSLYTPIRLSFSLVIMFSLPRLLPFPCTESFFNTFFCLFPWQHPHHHHHHLKQHSPISISNWGRWHTPPLPSPAPLPSFQPTPLTPVAQCLLPDTDGRKVGKNIRQCFCITIAYLCVSIIHLYFFSQVHTTEYRRDGRVGQKKTERWVDRNIYRKGERNIA